MSHLALDHAPTLPRRILVEPEAAALVPLVMGAMERWHRLRPGLFVLTGKSQDADVLVRISGETWVDMLSTPMVLRWSTEGHNWNQAMAMEHELCHVLGLGDHLPESWRSIVVGRDYHHLVFDADGDPNAYHGIADSLDVPSWFGAQDAAMLSVHWPLAHRVVVPEVSG